MDRAADSVDMTSLIVGCSFLDRREFLELMDDVDEELLCLLRVLWGVPPWDEPRISKAKGGEPSSFSEWVGSLTSASSDSSKKAGTKFPSSLDTQRKKFL